MLYIMQEYIMMIWDNYWDTNNINYVLSSVALFMFFDQIYKNYFVTFEDIQFSGVS